MSTLVQSPPGGPATRGHNEGSIFFARRDRRWRAAVTMPDGRHVTRPSPRNDNTRDGAKATLRELLEERDAEIEPPARKLTLAAYLRSWVAEMDRLAPATVRKYRIDVERHIIPGLGTDLRGREVLLSGLTSAAIQRWLDRMDVPPVGAPPEWEPPDPRTIQHRYAALRRALNIAVRRHLLVRNPALAVELPEIPERDAATLTAAELRTLLDGTADEWWGPLWALLAGTGLRISEALGLAWDDVDLDAGTVRVAAQIARRDGAWARVPALKAARSLERIALPAFARDALERHRRRMASERRPEWRFHGLVFVTPAGDPPYEWHLLEALYAAETRLGLPRMGAHGFRHSSATLLADAGVAEDVRMRRLGHATAAMARHYTHDAATPDRAAADALDVAIGGGR